MEAATGGTTRDHPGTLAPQAAGAARIPALTVLSHPDLVRIGDRAFLSELVRGREALLSRKSPRFAAAGAPGSEPLDDPYLSRTPLRLEPRPEGGLRFHRNGCQAAVTVDGRTLAESLTLSAESLSSGVVLALAERVVLWLSLRQSPSVEHLPRCGLVGESAGLEEVRRTVARLVPPSPGWGECDGRRGQGDEVSFFPASWPPRGGRPLGRSRSPRAARMTARTESRGGAETPPGKDDKGMEPKAPE